MADLKWFAIWSEGYIATGESGKAILHGSWQGTDFKDAVKRMMRNEKWDADRYYNEEKNTYWGCRFFDNESDARKAFG